MSTKSKIIAIIVVSIILLAIVGVIIGWIIRNTNQVNNNILEVKESKINKLYSELLEKPFYSFTTKKDNQNEMFYAKKNNQAYIKTVNKGKETKFIVKEGNTYFLVDDSKEYYVYENNETDLNKIVLELEKIKEKQGRKGKEKMEGKEYQYEEYEGILSFSTNNITEEKEAVAKTRFYFSGDNLVYIKTIIGNNQETLKVEISSQIEDKFFEIPTEYKEG